MEEEEVLGQRMKVEEELQGQEVEVERGLEEEEVTRQSPRPRSAAAAGPDQSARPSRSSYH